MFINGTEIKHLFSPAGNNRHKLLFSILVQRSTSNLQLKTIPKYPKPALSQAPRLSLSTTRACLARDKPLAAIDWFKYPPIKGRVAVTDWHAPALIIGLWAGGRGLRGVHTARGTRQVNVRPTRGQTSAVFVYGHVTVHYDAMPS